MLSVAPASKGFQHLFLADDAPMGPTDLVSFYPYSIVGGGIASFDFGIKDSFSFGFGGMIRFLHHLLVSQLTQPSTAHS
jgi:hypothetical protein